MSVIERQTKETRIRVDAKAGTGVGVSRTGIEFLDHMMVALARYAGLDLEISASGDLRHHHGLNATGGTLQQPLTFAVRHLDDRRT